MRARAEAKNAPAEPTRARMAVGFSGELSQPPSACSGRATASRRAKLKNFRADFFMDGLRVGRYRHSGKAWMQKAICQCENAVSVVPSWAVREKTVIWYIRGISYWDGYACSILHGAPVFRRAN
jgi:hypothetical protein